MTKRFVLWAAVSSKPQVEKVSIENQIELGRAVATGHGGTVVAELIVPGESRSIVLFEDAARRIEAYAKLKELIDDRAFDVFVFFDRSRLGRKASLSMAVIELCSESGIIIYDLESPPTTLDAIQSYDDMMLGAIKSVGAQREVQKIKERHRSGMIGRARKGQFPGNIPWGWLAVYDQHGKRTIEIDEQAAPIIRHALLDLYLAQNMPIRTIARELNRLGHRPPLRETWDRHSVQNLINLIERYGGYVELNRISPSGRPYIRERGQWPAILSDEEYKALKAERASRAASKRAVHSYLFSRMCTCARCGGRIIAHVKDDPGRKETTWYRCINACHGSYIRESVMFAAVEAAIAYAADSANREQLLAVMPDPRLAIMAALEQLDQDTQRIGEIRGRLTTAYVEFQTITGDEYKQRMDDYAQRIELIERRRSELQEELTRTEDEAARRVRLDEVARQGLEILHGEQQRANAWIRRHFRIVVGENVVSQIEYI